MVKKTKTTPKKKIHGAIVCVPVFCNMDFGVSVVVVCFMLVISQFKPNYALQLN